MSEESGEEPMTQEQMIAKTFEMVKKISDDMKSNNTKWNKQDIINEQVKNDILDIKGSVKRTQKSDTNRNLVIHKIKDTAEVNKNLYNYVIELIKKAEVDIDELCNIQNRSKYW